MSEGLPRKLRYAFLLQVVMASIVILAGTFVAATEISRQLAGDALQEEAAYFWRQRAADPAVQPADTVMLQGHLIAKGGSTASVPASMRHLQPGLHSLRDELVLVQESGDARLYLASPQAWIDWAVLQLLLLPVLLALLALAASAWFTYRNARRMVTPLSWLAQVVRGWDPLAPASDELSPDRLPPDSGVEALQLAGALQRMRTRMRAFVRREREFTRDASHELRTPLTVVRVATDMMQSDPELPDRLRRSLARIQSAGRDMEAVIEAFLILAREGGIEPQREDFQVREVVDEEVAKVRPLLAGRPIELEVVGNANPRLHASPRVLSVMLGNLLANASSFTERGRIEVRIEDKCVVVSDTGIGMSPEVLRRVFDPFYRAELENPSGKGMGLSIVRRLGERFGWPIHLDSSPARGTTAVIRFSA